MRWDFRQQQRELTDLIYCAFVFSPPVPQCQYQPAILVPVLVLALAIDRDVVTGAGQPHQEQGNGSGNNEWWESVVMEGGQRQRRRVPAPEAE